MINITVVINGSKIQVKLGENLYDITTDPETGAEQIVINDVKIPINDSMTITDVLNACADALCAQA